MTDYRDSGVDVPQADLGIGKIARRLKATWPEHGDPHAVMLDIGFFANVVSIGGGMGLAQTTDGVGSKIALCGMLDRWDTIGIDCVAMNVNDLLCVGAKPVSMVDYIAVDKVDAAILDRIGIGLAEGAHRAGVSVVGGEVSQLPGIINGVDLVGMASGLVPLNKILTGQNITVGDHIIGIESNGIHANGFSLARKVLFDENHLDPRGIYPQFGLSLGDELLRPTHIYVPEVLDLLQHGLPIKAVLHITGDGLLNCLRIARNDTGFLIDRLPDIPPIFRLIQDRGGLEYTTMFETFNMGIGLVIVVSPGFSDRVISAISKYGRRSWVIVTTIRDFYNTVYVKPYELVGNGKSFRLEAGHDEVTSE